jgi:hypothetical protein
MIVEAQDGNERAEYGDNLVKSLSKELKVEFGKGFTVTNLKYMRQFYLTFPKSHALRDQLSWTHYRLLMKIENEEIRKFYIEESIERNWSTRQLERLAGIEFYKGENNGQKIWWVYFNRIDYCDSNIGNNCSNSCSKIIWI